MERTIFGKTIHIPLNGLYVSRRLEFNLLMKYLNLRGDETLLDIACGDGYWTAKMKPRVQKVFGFDYNHKRLQQARKLVHDFGGIRCNAHVLPYKDAAFDCAIGICILEHFEDDVKALREIRRTMKPGGRLALTVDSFSYPGLTEEEKDKHAKKFSVIHLYKIEDLRKKLEKAGFELTDWSYLLRTRISSFLYLRALRFPRLAYFLYPISYPLSLWSEQHSKNLSCGYKLAVLATAV